MTPCPSPVHLQQFLDGTLEPDRHSSLDAHIAACAECQKRLDELVWDRTIDNLVRPLQKQEPDISQIRFPGPPTALGPLGTFGTFHVKEQLGEGAFGFVFRAFDEATGREVALKILKPQFAIVQAHRARFEREAKAAAAIRHPNVVTIYQVGSFPDSDVPYIVMEYLPGETLEQRLRRETVLAPAETARIMMQVAWGLAAAHTVHVSGSDPLKGGLVHRDVKPSNIMLETGQDEEVIARITDFGLARPISIERNVVSASGQILGTLPYMGPEQIQSPTDVDCRTDVYSLGAVGYEMLAGNRPYDAATPGDVIRLICEASSQGPIRYNANVPRDLDTIIVKCLAKEPTRRYQTARDLADDLGRFSRGEPILARPVTGVERFWRWCKRKPMEASLAASLAAALFVGSVISTWYAIRATRQRDRAVAAEVLASDRLVEVEQANAQVQQALTEAQAAKAETDRALEVSKQAHEQAAAVSKYLVEAFRSPDPSLDGEAITVANLLDRALKNLETEFDGSAKTKGDLLNALGETYLGLGLPAKAIETFQKARMVRTETLGPEAPDTLTSIGNLASAYQDAGRPDDAMPLIEETLKLRKITLGPDHRDTLESMNNLALALQDAGRLDEALLLYDETIKLKKANLGPDHPDTLTSMSNLASAFQDADQLDKAVPLFEETLKLSKAKLKPDHPDTLRTMNNLAFAYYAAERLDEAVPLYIETINLQKTKLGPDHPGTLKTMNNLAGAYYATGRLEEAVPLYEETLKFTKAKLGSDHTDTLISMFNLGGAYRKANQLVKAETVLRECLEIRQARRPEEWLTFEAKVWLGIILRELGRFPEAEPLLTDGFESLHAREQIIPPSERHRILRAMEEIVKLYESWDKQEEAGRWRGKLEQSKK